VVYVPKSGPTYGPVGFGNKRIKYSAIVILDVLETGDKSRKRPRP